MILQLIQSVALLITLCVLQVFVARFAHDNRLIGKVLSGALFGGICVIGMLLPVEVTPGVIIDPRSVILSMAGLFGGPIVAAITAVIAITYRLFVGGDGVYVGVVVVLACTSFGLAYRYIVNKGWAKINIVQLFLFGLVLHVVQLLLFTQLPAELVNKVLTTVAIPLILIFAPATALLGMLLQDIDNRFKTESALKKSEFQLLVYLQNTPLAAISWDVNFHCIQWNKAAEKMFGYSADEVLGRHALTLITPEGEKENMDALFKLLIAQKGGARYTNENKTQNGSNITCNWYNTVLVNDEGQGIGVVSLAEDITPRKQAEALIWKQANYDALTGLANREMLTEHLHQEIKKADRFANSVALLYLDLDQFKDINDTLGHHTGDILLVEAAKRLNQCVRDVDVLARVGGDEFSIIMGELRSFEGVERVANALLKKLAEPFQLGDETAYISISIGITFYPSDASNSVEMFKNADQAMYAAKKLGRNCFQYFTTSMQEDAMSRMTLINDLRVALPQEEFKLYYQPIISLVDNSIHKAEALIRWQHPTRGLVSPAEFIPIAEETRMIVEIGDWVFREAAKQTRLWRAAFHPDFQISVNTSPVQYLHTNFSVTDWLGYLQSLGLPGNAITVEITEGLLMNTDSSITDMLLIFRDAGIQVALDDFGTGYSSLSYLKKLDIDYLKIDQIFVRNLKADSDDLALCEAIIVMAHRLGLKVIAEGIETKEQSDLLTAAGCDFGQGYLFSKPMPAQKFESMFNAHKHQNDQLILV
jgi:diguanylate cyclase (GGDEF)-like protein/PAS domain S-box-containing protein